MRTQIAVLAAIAATANAVALNGPDGRMHKKGLPDGAIQGADDVEHMLALKKWSSTKEKNAKGKGLALKKKAKLALKKGGKGSKKDEGSWNKEDWEKEDHDGEWDKEEHDGEWDKEDHDGEWDKEDHDGERPDKKEHGSRGKKEHDGEWDKEDHDGEWDKEDHDGEWDKEHHDGEWDMEDHDGERPDKEGRGKDGHDGEHEGEEMLAMKKKGKKLAEKKRGKKLAEKKKGKKLAEKKKGKKLALKGTSEDATDKKKDGTEKKKGGSDKKKGGSDKKEKHGEHDEDMENWSEWDCSEWDEEPPCDADDMYCWGFVDGYHAAMMDMTEWDEEDHDHDWEGSTDGDDAVPEEPAATLAMKKRGKKLASKKGGDKQDWHCELWEEDDQPWCVEWETRCNEDPVGCWDDMAAEWEKEDKP